ncbi:MAG TPA: hypothetical protein VFF73_20300 [Planctomycetota bacterium]|nr:hypothetical protein [Planctomycetota bacterium]
MERKSFLDRLRAWLRGENRPRGKPSVWNEPAPANKAGDAPLITSHGQGPSHAH